MAENDKNTTQITAFAGENPKVDLSAKEKETREKPTEGDKMNPSSKEVEMTSTQSTSQVGQEAINSMTASMDGIKLKKRLSGAQKKKLAREKKMAEGTWVEKPKPKQRGEKRQSQRMEQDVAPKAARKEGPEGITFKEALTAVKMAVILEGHPLERLSEEQALDLEFLITEKISRNEEGFVPTFLSCRLENGALIINCADLGSSKWLEQIVVEINPWQEQTLLVGEARKLVRTTKIIAKLPKVCSKLESKEVLRKIEAQNGGLTPTEWNILHRKNEPSGQTIVLSVPELDAATLGKRGYKFYIGLHQVQAKVLDKPSKNDGGEGSSSQHPPQ